MCTYARETRTMNHNTEHQPKTGIETPSTHETRAAVFPEKKESKIGRKGQMAIIGGIVTGIAVVGVGGAKWAESNASSPDPTPEPSVEAPVVPGPVEATPSDEPSNEVSPSNPTNIPELEKTVAELAIPVGLPAEELGPLVTENLRSWVETGSDTTLRDRLFKANVSLDDFLIAESEPTAELFADELFIPGWESDPALSQTVAHYTEENQGVLKNTLGHIARGEAIPPVNFKNGPTVEFTTEEQRANGERVLHIRLLDTENTGYDVIVSVTLQDVNGFEKISRYDADSVEKDQ